MEAPAERTSPDRVRSHLLSLSIVRQTHVNKPLSQHGSEEFGSEVALSLAPICATFQPRRNGMWPRRQHLSACDGKEVRSRGSVEKPSSLRV